MKVPITHLAEKWICWPSLVRLLPTIKPSLTSAISGALLLGASLSASAADGFGGNATGGAGGAAVTVTTAAELITYATAPQPYIITVSGTITVSGGTGTSGGSVRVKSNKTIQGADTNATINGTLDLGSGGVTNVIIRNLNLTNPNNIGTGDGITCFGAQHVFITQCSFFDTADGCCDINNSSDYVTVSWCKFYYSSSSLAHRFTMISGNTTEPDPNVQRITLHHNWWAQNCDQRMPSGSYCKVHMYNNYFSCTGNSYCSNGRAGSQMLSENNYYNTVKSPIYKELGGLMSISGNTYVSCTGIAPDAGTDTVFTPPYSYTLDSTANVPSIVQAGAGNIGGGDTNPPAAPTGLTATAGNNQVALSWTASSGATSYNVKRATVSGGAYTTIASPTSTSYTDTTAVNGTTYYYVVSAVNSAGESGNSNEASATPSCTAPSTPTGLNATTGDAQVGLSWSTASGAMSYNVKRATTSGGSYTTIASPTGTSYTDTTVVNGTTYYYVVSAVNSCGESENSSEASATPQAPSETILEQSTSTGNKADIKKGLKGAQSFRHGSSGGPSYMVTKLVLHLSKENNPNGPLVVSLGTSRNGGTIAGSSVTIQPSQITNNSSGSTFMTYTITYGTAVGPLTADTTYYINLDAEQAGNGKAYFVEESSSNTYANGTYFKGSSDDGKDAWFQIWGQ